MNLLLSRRIGHALAGATLVFLMACSDKSNSSVKPGAPSTSSTPSPGKTAPSPLAAAEAVAEAKVEHHPFRSCTTGAFTPPAAVSFRHRRSKLIAKMGRVAHSAQDVIAKPGESVIIPGKFAYGRVSKDLEDESVAVFLDDCDGWTALGEATTDGDGRTALAIPSDSLPGVGVFGIRQVMKGDASTTASRLTIVPAGSRLVVLDVDGTLTIGDDELSDEIKDVYLDELISGKRHPEAYPGAAALTKAWEAKGYLVVYMTGRPYWLAGLTRDWLDSQGCAPGHLHTTDRNRDALPGQSGVGEYKAAYLSTLIEAGYLLDYVYGNAESDVFAYARAGVAPSRTHIIGEFGGQGGTRALSGGYTEHLTWVAEQPVAKQPFTVPRP